MMQAISKIMSFRIWKDNCPLLYRFTGQVLYSDRLILRLWISMGISHQRARRCMECRVVSCYAISEWRITSPQKVAVPRSSTQSSASTLPSFRTTSHSKAEWFSPFNAQSSKSANLRCLATGQRMVASSMQCPILRPMKILSLPSRTSLVIHYHLSDSNRAYLRKTGPSRTPFTSC